MISRTEAKMIAEELFKLIKADKQPSEEWLNVKQAAQHLSCSIQFIYNNIDKIPHEKFGRNLKFRKSALDSMVLR